MLCNVRWWHAITNLHESSSFQWWRELCWIIHASVQHGSVRQPSAGSCAASRLFMQLHVLHRQWLHSKSAWLREQSQL
jgi:hypothetical protein